MRLLIKNHFENAYNSLKANRARTTLTLIGVAISIASITTTLSLLTGANKLIGDQASRIADSVAIIRSGTKPSDPKSVAHNGVNDINTITEQDAHDIAELPGAAIAPMSLLRTKVSGNHDHHGTKAATLVGSNGALRHIAELDLREGQFIDEVNGAVISQQLSVDLFGTEKSLGNLIKIRGETLTVAGIIRPTDTSHSYLGVNFNEAVIVPVAVAKKFTQDTAQVQQIIISSPDRHVLDDTLARATEILRKHHHDDSDFHTLTGQEIVSPSTTLANIIILVTTIIAGISLIVGGISIMNVMLVSVAERQREIGIRRAIGASTHHIVNQFLIESAIIGLLSGIIGYGLGLGAAFLLSIYLPFTPLIHWQIAVCAIGLSLLIGIFFGIYPAIHAAQKDPIESLRLG